jgi:hypothetical protein
VARLHIISHCLPREIDDFDRMLDHLHRSAHFLEKGDEVVLDATLNLSDKLTNWEDSKIPKEYFLAKWEMMERKADWTHKNIFDVVDDGSVLGCNDTTSHFTYMDCDVFFPMFMLSYIFRSLEQIDTEYHIVNPQILKLWDESWDVISNDRWLHYGFDSFIWKSYDHYALDKECYDYLEEVNIKPIPTIKFGGGLFCTFSSNLLSLIDIPDTFPGYGLDDTFVATCCLHMLQNGYPIRQYLLENIIVMENKKYKFENPYVKLLSDNTLGDGGNVMKKQFLKVAEANFGNEVEKFMRRLSGV